MISLENLMPEGFFNPVVITILFILLSTVVAAFIRGRKKDKCLKSFGNFMVTLEESAGKRIWGTLRVEATGMEILYAKPHTDIDGHIESSYLVYKYEYGTIAAIIRYHDMLTTEQCRQRQQELDYTYHPNWFRRFRRKTANVFKTIRDSIMEVSNVLLSQAKKTTGAGTLLSSQDKYVSQMQNEVIGSVDTAYEPLLERYIGHRVVAEFVQQDKPVEIQGVLKDYTSEFIELLDVDYPYNDTTDKKKADIILPRKRAIVRHLSE
jgi:hypothetical protein